MRKTFDHVGLLAWFRAHRRAMPWREHPSPYAVWVSEIMLQQTQVETVRPYFDRFVARFPSVEALARAEGAAVLKAWEGLGYYARARNLHRAAHVVVARLGGRVPETADQLAALPGIGAYTAAAIASICFGERVPVVDGNVARVFARVRRLDDDFRKPAARNGLAAWLQPAFRETVSPGDLNQAMMELGALVCRPRHPACVDCPLAQGCAARRRGVQGNYPKRTAGAPAPVRQAVAVILKRGTRLLMTQRAEAGLLGGFWELPGGEMDADESVEAAARRWLRSRTGYAIGPVEAVGSVKHLFSHFTLLLHVVRARPLTREATARRDPTVRWISASERAQLPVATAHRRALDAAGA